MKPPMLALALLSLAPALAAAQGVPKDSDACFDMSGALLESARDVPEAVEAKVQQLAREVEAACDAGKFDTAAAKANELKSLTGSK